MPKSEIYRVSRLLDIRYQKGKIYVLIKWKGYRADESTWEPWRNVNSRALPELLRRLGRELPARQNLIRLLERLADASRRKADAPARRANAKPSLRRTRGTPRVALSSSSCGSTRAADCPPTHEGGNRWFGLEAYRGDDGQKGFRCRTVENGCNTIRALDTLYLERPKETYEYLKDKLAELYRAKRAYEEELKLISSCDVARKDKVNRKTL